ncbi:MAG: Flp pilus assembly protein CpaB [Phycisphaerae bacterium]|jgi:pilus assembly protein CpaB
MKGKAIIPLAVGLAIGVFAIKYFVSVIKKAQGATTTEMVQVVYANSDIPLASEIKETMIDVRSVPKAVVPKLYISDRKEVIGRVAGQQIVTGMPIVQNFLAPKGTPPGLEIRIPKDHRAVAVQVDEFTGVAGWINPGSRVDVIAVLNGRTSQESISKVILQNVQVLAVGQDIGSKNDATASVPKSVTLSVHKDSVSLLHLAAAKGKMIRLAMRSQTDDELSRKVAQTTDNELVGNPAGSQGGASSKIAGLLAGFLKQVPKPDANATDKEPRAREPQPVVRPVAVVDKRDWVQVYTGSEFKEELGFSREGGSWRLVACKSKKDMQTDQGESQEPGSGAAPSPLPKQRGLPSPLARPLN